ncbi:MAG: hypothetical protein MI919_22250 [Holophagales bacterium]|nr:hypothetical protein [Holophagales bacterium]
MFRKTGKLCALGAILMLFVAPVAHADEAVGAVKSALECLETLVEEVLDFMVGGGESASGEPDGEGGGDEGDQNGGYSGSIEPVG